MSAANLNDLDRRIAERLVAEKDRTLQHHNHFAERMHEYEERQGRYTAIADRLTQHVIRPRMERLAVHFDNAELSGCGQAGRHQCVCSFKRTPRFPATAKLELGVSRDGQAETVFFLYNLCILPIFFEFDNQDQLAIPLERIDEGQVAEWVEKKLLAFLDTYLRLETVEQYQTENMVTDPVCGMRINRLYAVKQMEHGGKTYYFCLPECLTKFATDPDKYLGVKLDSKPVGTSR